jgi:linoleoyl-CoA desaturase
MIIKTVFMFMLYIVPFIFIYSLPALSPLGLIGLYIIISFGKAGIGMGIMHDANHNSYSSNKNVNNILGLSLNLIGANKRVWNIQHNILHHTYTNIDGADDDLNVPGLLRFSPHTKLRKIHRFQHIYAWLLYGLSTLFWMTSKDFVRITRFRKMGMVKDRRSFYMTLLNITFWKVIYFSYALVIPILIVPFSGWYVVLAFVLMHLITGLALSVVFQTAHVMPDTDFPLPAKSGKIEEDWYVHQLTTTTNFAPKSRIISWLIGGLNYQVEHHLLPKVCHIHYRKISPIIRQTASEFNLPYLTKKNVLAAIADHYRMLKQLGRPVSLSN